MVSRIVAELAKQRGRIHRLVKIDLEPTCWEIRKERLRARAEVTDGLPELSPAPVACESRNLATTVAFHAPHLSPPPFAADASDRQTARTRGLNEAVLEGGQPHEPHPRQEDEVVASQHAVVDCEPLGGTANCIAIKSVQDAAPLDRTQPPREPTVGLDLPHRARPRSPP